MADERHDFVMRELARVDDALHAAEEALGLLFLDFEPGTLTLQHAAWQQVRAVLGMPILPYPAGVGEVPRG